MGDEETRYGFGRNWKRFLKLLDQDRIDKAALSLTAMLSAKDLSGRTFLDVGSGSGLFSLAARQLGAAVHSFDYDVDSVACTEYLRSKFRGGDSGWKVEQGSILDKSYIDSLGTFDVVYSWGVLHHTGKMWEACSNAASLVRPGGLLFIALYNDQGAISRLWLMIKKLYAANALLRCLIIAAFTVYFAGVGLLADLLYYRRDPRKRYTEYRSVRGMSRFTDLLDWLGGLPFEVAKPEQVFQFFSERGFRLSKLVTVGGSLACNEFVFLNEQLKTGHFVPGQN